MGMEIFDYLWIIGGIYIIIVTLKMRSTGEIPEGVLINKGTNIDYAKDKQGFIDNMFLKTLILGILSLCLGGSGVIGTKVPYMSTISSIMSIVFLAYFIAFVIMNRKAQNTYL